MYHLRVIHKKIWAEVLVLASLLLSFLYDDSQPMLIDQFR